MSTSMIRVSKSIHRTLKEIAQEEMSSLQHVLKKAIENYRRQMILEKTNEAYAKLREDPDAWDEELAERALWEKTTADDLDD